MDASWDASAPAGALLFRTRAEMITSYPCLAFYSISVGPTSSAAASDSSCAKESALDTLLQETLLQKIFTNTLPQQLFWKISSSRTLFFRSYSSAIEIFTAALSSSPTLVQ
ncbi:unnamed protein product [Sphagnum jensenii]|uniref:Uncharacterized protein n=1 Tax=Sphagnum jensenii TaxID=128206 RepID=A0ABP1AB76_9BRYO